MSKYILSTLRYGCESDTDDINKEYNNELTRELDKYLIDGYVNEYSPEPTYLCHPEQYDNGIICSIRVPGATRGALFLTNNYEVKDIDLIESTCFGSVACYKESLRESLQDIIDKYKGDIIYFSDGATSKWYFTFGFDHKYPNCAQIIEASNEYFARAKMFDMYGNKFCTSYSQDIWDEMKNDPKRPYPMMKELPDIVQVSDEEAIMLIENGVFNKR